MSLLQNAPKGPALKLAVMDKVAPELRRRPVWQVVAAAAIEVMVKACAAAPLHHQHLGQLVSSAMLCKIVAVDCARQALHTLLLLCAPTRAWRILPLNTFLPMEDQLGI